MKNSQQKGNFNEKYLLKILYIPDLKNAKNRRLINPGNYLLSMV